MSTSVIAPTSYRVETSGWDVDENFFVEKTDLEWTEEEKTIHLQHAVRKETVVFVRLMGMDVQENTFPVAYQAASVNYRMHERYYDVSLLQMLPRMQAAVDAERSRK
jgi:hypothetical protein